MTVPVASTPEFTVHQTHHIQLRADRARLRVHLAGAGSTPGRAVAAVRRVQDRVGAVLSRWDAEVGQVTFGPVGLVPAEGDGSHRATCVVEVSGVAAVSLPGLHRGLGRLRGVQLGAIDWTLGPDHAVFTLIRREVSRQVQRQAREIAEVVAADTTTVLLSLVVDPPHLSTHHPTVDGADAQVVAGVVGDPPLLTVTASATGRYRLA